MVSAERMTDWAQAAPWPRMARIAGMRRRSLGTGIKIHCWGCGAQSSVLGPPPRWWQRNAFKHRAASPIRCDLSRIASAGLAGREICWESGYRYA